MNDTILNSPVLRIFNKDSKLSSSEVHVLLDKNVSLVTIKRQLSELLKEDLLIQFGAGRSVKYSLSKKGLFLRPIETESYFSNNPDIRLSHNNYQFDLFQKPHIELFTAEELNALNNATINFREKSNLTNTQTRKKELMRFIIEFSWKTSQIEGNTYDIISTERLLQYGEKSPTNTEYETQMIINQKDALEFILENIKDWHKPNLALIEKLHNYVGNDLNISKGFRKSLVGITGTNYRPLENEFQIKEAVENLLNFVNLSNNTYEKALLSVLGLSYIQPFVDGNKRTARLLGNAYLLCDNLAPLSYRSVDDRDYKKATLAFYEQNSVEPFKKIFIEQYIFSANNYNISQ